MHSTTSVANAETLVHEQVEQLVDVFQRSFEKGEVLELRMRFLAFTTDTVALFCLGQSTNIQNNERRAEEWNRTMRTVTKVTPFVKQFPWIINIALKLPIGLVHSIMPNLTGVLQLHHVGCFQKLPPYHITDLFIEIRCCLSLPRN